MSSSEPIIFDVLPFDLLSQSHEYGEGSLQCGKLKQQTVPGIHKPNFGIKNIVRNLNPRQPQSSGRTQGERTFKGFSPFRGRYEVM